MKLYNSPNIGHFKLSKLNGDQLVNWQAKMARKGISADISFRTDKVLRAALNQAAKLSLLPYI